MPALQPRVQENAWDSVGRADVTMACVGTTVIHGGTAIVTVTVVATEARNVITMVATETGVIVVLLLLRVADIRLTIGVAEVHRGALGVSGALPAVLTEEITKLL